MRKKADKFKIVMNADATKIPWSTADDAALIDLVAQRSSGVDLIWDVGKKSIELNLFAEIDGFMPLILRSSVKLGAPKRTQLFESCTFNSTAVSAKSLAICQAGPIMSAGIGSAASSLSKLVQQTC